MNTALLLLCLLAGVLSQSDPFSPENNCVFTECSKEWRACQYEDKCQKLVNQCISEYLRFQEMAYAPGKLNNCLIDNDHSRQLLGCLRRKCRTPPSNCLLEAFRADRV